MFKSFEYGEYEDCLVPYKVIDTEFVHTGNVIWNAYVIVVLVRAVIDTYTTRNLNVTGNLMVAIKWYTDIWCIGIEKAIELARMVPEFARYETDITKYLALM